MPDAIDRLTHATLRLRGYTSRAIPTREGRVHVLVGEGRGDAPPVALLHGFGSAGIYLGPLLHRLRRDASRVIAPDMPSHGMSGSPRSGMRPSVLLDAVFEALDCTIEEPVVLVGNSMGGYAAVRYARSRPERVRALVLCSPAGAFTGDDEEALEQVRRVFRIRDHAAALEFVDRLLAKPPPLKHLVALAVRRKFRQRDLRDLLERIRPDDALAPAELSSIDVPTLLLWGVRDRILPETDIEFWRAHLPQGTPIERPEGMGHSPYLDRPGALSRRILEFARSAPAPVRGSRTPSEG